MYRLDIDKQSSDYLKSLPEQDRKEGQRLLMSINERGCSFLKPCENKHDFNLEGCYAAYFGNARHRIIAEEIEPGHIVVWAIGARQDFTAFRKASERRNPDGKK